MEAIWIWNGNCEETRESLSDYLDGSLHGLRRFRVVRHLARCRHCRAVLASLLRAVEQLQSLGRLEPAPSSSTADAVLDRIRRESG